MTDVDSSLDPTWLPLPEAADAIGVEFRRLRSLIRDGEVVAVRVAGLQGPRIPSAFLAGEGGGLLDGLRGSITQLRDAGLDDGALVTWLLEPLDELGMTPARALAEGQKHAVRRAAVSLAF